MERVSLQPAYILHARPYRDTSALLEVFTAEHGRLTLVAKGVRRASRKRGAGAVPQPFAPLLLSFTGRSDLKTLTGSETAGAPVVLHGERLYSGMYLNELLVRLLHRFDPHPQLFAAYADALAALSRNSVPLDGALRRFELILLDELGYRVQFDIEGQAHRAVQADRDYQYDPAVGLTLSLDSQPGKHLFRGEELLAMARGEFDGPARLAARRLLREALAIHLGERPLNSRELFRQTVVSSGSEAGSKTAALDRRESQ